ncbi:hypothetical protein B5X24_HaOG214735 [Helicoverpa armigera]|nr:hypothetical protein B5X24_HaOG214735 [Helicoverpa armigera]
MFLFVLFITCVLQPLVQYIGVNGRRESLKRFVVEEGSKPAIFGSYSYDPVKQVFVPPQQEGGEGGTPTDISPFPPQFVNDSYISTAIGDLDQEPSHPGGPQHVTPHGAGHDAHPSPGHDAHPGPGHDAHPGPGHESHPGDPTSPIFRNTPMAHHWRSGPENKTSKSHRSNDKDNFII